jgi:hypothetical protein
MPPGSPPAAIAAPDIPDSGMHRVAVDVQHWMTDKPFADVFAISQISPGPNVLIVTLTGYFRRRRRGRAGCNAGEVRSDRRACLVCQPPAHAIEPVTLARHYSGGAGSTFNRIDGAPVA